MTMKPTDTRRSSTSSDCPLELGREEKPGENNMDFQENVASNKSTYPDDTTGQPGEADDNASWTQALSRRTKQRMLKETRLLTRPNATTEYITKASTHGTLPTKPTKRQSRPRMWLLPLPKEDVKIIIRPRQGLSLKDHSTVEITQAIARACGNKTQSLHDLIIRPRVGSNILILSTYFQHEVDNELKQSQRRGAWLPTKY